jgi:cyanophycinase-like exopeptidase
MGSGETSPTMVTAHQQCLKEVDSEKAVFLDTPFGFQENADDLTSKILDYFKTSVGAEISHLKLRTPNEPADQVAKVFAAIADAQWVFTGPGSPSYTVKTWQTVGLGQAFERMLERGTLVAASAAALTIGSHTIPVYEIYKVGEEPRWLTGMNLIERVTGLKAIIVPHYNNNEGTNHDTRFCYMGERRMALLEEQLPADTFIMGIDEHTGVRLDLDGAVAHVFGKGGMTIRKGDRVTFYGSGSAVEFGEIANAADVQRSEVAELTTPEEHDLAAFNRLLEAGEIQKATEVVLKAQAAQKEAERIEVSAAISRLGDLAARPQINTAEIIAPYVDALLAARNLARVEKQWALADQLRDALLQNRIEVKDTPDGSTWSLAD